MTDQEAQKLAEALIGYVREFAQDVEPADLTVSEVVDDLAESQDDRRVSRAIREQGREVGLSV